MTTQVLPFSDIKHLVITPALLDSNSMVAVIGDLSRFPPNRIAIVNSRQRRLPYADDPWLASTSSAAERAISSNRTVVSSIGMITWEWMVWNIARLRGHQIIVMPRGKVAALQDRVREVIDDFCLAEERATFLMPFSPKDKPFRKVVYPERDRWVVALAHHIQPVAVRSSGIMSRLLNEPSLSGKIDTSSRITPSKSRRRPDILRQLASKSDTLIRYADGFEYLTHWTRACHGPWLGERSSDFYSKLFLADSGYPRDGIATLKRILIEGRIRASGRMMPGGIPMTSWTATSPAELLKIIRWRPGYIRWNFEPYGISIQTHFLKSLGARKVTYGTSERFDQPDSADRAFFQRITPDRDWSIEQEWRLPGDFSLRDLKPDDAVVWVLNPSQRAEVQSVSPFPVQALLA
jgi:hypothetical protein